MTAGIDRREFVARCSCVGALFAVSGCVAMVTHPVPVVDGRVALSLTEFPELSAPLGAIKIQPTQLADPLYVLSQPGGGFLAVSPICTHRGCTVDVQSERLVCPCHGSTYDRAGKVLRGPAQRALTSYPVTQRGDVLMISVVESRSLRSVQAR